MPKFNEQLLEAPLRLRKPAHILVGFTGDGFGPGTIIKNMDRVLEIVQKTPQHTYYFLTKSPELLRCYNPWPQNAWAGASITGAESFERQLEIVNDLRAVEGNRWISWEPILGLLEVDVYDMDWLVMGAQTGPGAIHPKREWIDRFWENQRLDVGRLWVKNNLLKLFPNLPRIQERP